MTPRPLDPRTYLSDRLRGEVCARCRRPVLRGLDHRPAGVDTRVDPVPLDLAEEITARLNGRRCYDAVRIASGLYLMWRDLDRIQDQGGYPVLATHACEFPAPARPHLRARLAPTISANLVDPPF